MDGLNALCGILCLAGWTWLAVLCTFQPHNAPFSFSGRRKKLKMRLFGILMLAIAVLAVWQMVGGLFRR